MIIGTLDCDVKKNEQVVGCTERLKTAGIDDNLVLKREDGITEIKEFLLGFTDLKSDDVPDEPLTAHMCVQIYSHGCSSSIETKSQDQLCLLVVQSGMSYR